MNHLSVCRKYARSNLPKPVRRHSRVTNDEIIFDLAAASAVSNIQVENLAAPFGEYLDRVVEGTGIVPALLEAGGTSR